MSRTSLRVNPYSIFFLNVKELLARSRHHIWSSSDRNRICSLNSRLVPASNKEILDIQSNYRLWIHSQTRTWHDNSISLNWICTQNITSDLFFQRKITHKITAKVIPCSKFLGVPRFQVKGYTETTITLGTLLSFSQRLTSGKV